MQKDDLNNRVTKAIRDKQMVIMPTFQELSIKDLPEAMGGIKIYPADFNLVPKECFTRAGNDFQLTERQPYSMGGGDKMPSENAILSLDSERRSSIDR